MHLKWDKYSDQPAVIKDKALKKQIYKENQGDFFKTLLTSLFVYPVAYGFYWLIPPQKRAVSTQVFFGLSVNLDKNPQQTRSLVDELDVNNLLIRMPLHDIENLSFYVAFAEKFKDKNIIINILQDRRHIEDQVLAKQSFELIFERFSHLTQRFQIGNAINRKKWAIFSMAEYLQFYKVAFDLKQAQFPKLTLLGSSVIDFEYYFTLRTLFNRYKVRFDECSALLYVDRRGAPENTQMGLDLTKKLRMLHAMLRLSPKTGKDIVITETNWPITQTAPYAPTSENDCVSLEDHANFLVRYYLLALSSGVVKQVYWHQLIAPGYGLMDNRGDKLVKYPAYYAFKFMITMLQGADYKGSNKNGEVYQLSFLKDKQTIDVFWSLSAVSLESVISYSNKKVFSKEGNKLEQTAGDEIMLRGSPIYVLGA